MVDMPCDSTARSFEARSSARDAITSGRATATSAGDAQGAVADTGVLREWTRWPAPAAATAAAAAAEAEMRGEAGAVAGAGGVAEAVGAAEAAVADGSADMI